MGIFFLRSPPFLFRGCSFHKEDEYAYDTVLIADRTETTKHLTEGSEAKRQGMTNHELQEDR